MTPSSFRHFALFRSTGFITIVLILLVLAIQNAGSWYALQILRLSKEEELERHLEDLGRSAQLALGPEVRLALADQLAGQRTEPAAANGIDEDASDFHPSPALVALFDGFAARSRLANLTLLDSEGGVLMGLSNEDDPGEHFEFIDLDREAFDSALQGRSRGSVVHSVRDALIKRVYVPLGKGESGQPEAVLCLAAGRDYLDALARVTRRVRFLSAISTGAVLLIGWFVYGLLARQRRFEQRAAHADRLSSLGTLAAGFAHEIRNPLEIISATTEDLESSLARSPSAPGTAAESCRDILEEVDRLNRLVSQFLQYARADASPVSGGTAQLGEVLTAAISMVRHAAEKRGVSLVLEDANSLGHDSSVSIDGDQLRQVILNLLMNAVQATPERGVVRIETVGTPREAGVRIVDSGAGIPPALRSRIFDPFFTTRPEGSGLGLSIAHQLVSAARGALVAEPTATGLGASFLVMLPRAPGEPGPARTLPKSETLGEAARP